jgi:Domain of unknown function (DUF4261)
MTDPTRLAKSAGHASDLFALICPSFKSESLETIGPVESIHWFCVSEVVATHRSCSGVLWDLTVANSSEVAAEFSRSAFAPYPDFPTGLWVGTHPFRDPGASRIGVVTSGLRSFIGREVELEAPDSQLRSALTTVRALVAYLLQQDRRVLDGDTIGATADERILVRLRDSRHFKGLPVIAASLAGT